MAIPFASLGTHATDILRSSSATSLFDPSPVVPPGPPDNAFWIGGEIKAGQSVNTVSGLHYSGTLVNHGQIHGTMIGISGASGDIENYGTISSDEVAIIPIPVGNLIINNYGTISGIDSFVDPSHFNSAIYHISNFGDMNGNVFLGGGAGSTFDSSHGTVEGVIHAGQTGDIIHAATNGGTVLGGGGNDSLFANTSQAAADHHTTTVLDGGGGHNDLHGGSGFTVFEIGNGYGNNDVYGGLSHMKGVSGYTNNTISFEHATEGARVYLDTGIAQVGHEFDTIHNVPNVIGSKFADTILCDSGTDHITGGGGGDNLIAGKGHDTFLYNAFADSNATGKDTMDSIAGFKSGIDKIDITAFEKAEGITGASHIHIATSGHTSTVYVEHGTTFDAAHDLALTVDSTHGLHVSDFLHM